MSISPFSTKPSQPILSIAQNNTKSSPQAAVYFDGMDSNRKAAGEHINISHHVTTAASSPPPSHPTKITMTLIINILPSLRKVT